MITNETIEFEALRRFADGAIESQRTLADSLGISLGKANYVARALVQKGLVKLENVARNPNRRGYLYVLTPRGVTEKARLTRRFLERKVAEYAALQREIDTLAREAGVSDVRDIGGKVVGGKGVMGSVPESWD